MWGRKTSIVVNFILVVLGSLSLVAAFMINPRGFKAFFSAAGIALLILFIILELKRLFKEKERWAVFVDGINMPGFNSEAEANDHIIENNLKEKGAMAVQLKGSLEGK